MTDIQAEINGREQMQACLNTIKQSNDILSGDISMFTADYITKVTQDRDDAWTVCGQIAVSMLTYKDIAVPKPLDVAGMTTAGIIPAVDDTVEVSSPSVESSNVLS